MVTSRLPEPALLPTVAMLREADQRGTVDVVEQSRAEVTVLVDALGLLAVDLISDHQRHAAQLVERRVEHVLCDKSADRRFRHR